MNGRVCRVENGRTGREGKDDVGKGEGRSSNAAQAAFDADEEGWRGEKGGSECMYTWGKARERGGTNSARRQTGSRRRVRRSRGRGRERREKREERRERGKGRQWMEGKGAGRDETTRVAKLKPTREG
jgi:hypothetical protein